MREQGVEEQRLRARLKAHDEGDCETCESSPDECGARGALVSGIEIARMAHAMDYPDPKLRL